MTHAADDHSLSSTQLIVLARLSCARAPSDDELSTAVTEVVFADEPAARARARMVSDLAELRRLGLVQPAVNKLTDDGRRRLRKAFAVGRTPTWTQIRDSHISALALELSPGSDDAKQIGRSEALMITLLRRQTELPRASTVAVLCDALVARRLGLPAGPLTLGRIRAHVLAQHLNVDSTGTAKDVAARAARASLVDVNTGADKDKPSLRQLVARRWVYKSIAPANHAKPPLRAATVQTALPGLPRPPGPPSQGPADAIAADTLLNLVREAIPRIGADGRFGAEKVFVSALWRRLESDRRLANLSLDRFKRWLVTANRDQLLDLARADTRGHMDAQLLEESEIIDLGATFHFVVDRGITAASRGLHAR